MTNPYSSVTVPSSYNANPPPDDGSEVAANEIKWSSHKDKIGDPLKQFSESINTNVLAAFSQVLGGAVSNEAANFTITSADRGKFFICSNNITVSFDPANSIGSNFCVAIQKADVGNTVTIDPDGSETIDGNPTLVLRRLREAVIVTCDGSNFFTASTPANALVTRGQVDGMTLAIGTDTDHDIDVAPGQFTDSANSLTLDNAATITKQIDVDWVEGSGQGGFPSSLTLATDTWYHVFAIAKQSGEVDAGFDTSLTAANLLSDATGYTLYRRLGSVLTDASSNLVPFTQMGDQFLWDTPIEDVNQLISVSATLHTLSVPTGIKVVPLAVYTWGPPPVANLTYYGIVTSPDQTDVTPSSSLFNLILSGYNVSPASASTASGHALQIRTNTSSQVRSRATGATSNIVILTSGWLDLRGKDA